MSIYYHVKKFDVMADKVVANYGGGYTSDDVKSIVRGYKMTSEICGERMYYTRKGCKYMYLVDVETSDPETASETTVRVHFDGELACGAYIKSASVVLPKDYTMHQLVSAIRNRGFISFMTETMGRLVDIDPEPETTSETTEPETETTSPDDKDDKDATINHLTAELAKAKDIIKSAVDEWHIVCDQGECDEYCPWFKFGRCTQEWSAEADALSFIGSDYKADETYEAWVMMDSDNGVITEEYETPDEAIAELSIKYSIDEMHEAGFTCNKLLCNKDTWLECLDEIDY